MPTINVAKPANYRAVLMFQNAKTVKGEKLGYLTGICYLAPANEAGRGNLCQFATEGCMSGCLYKSGLAAIYRTVNDARIRRTHRLFDDREHFLACMRYDIAQLVRRAKRLRLTPCVRVNGTSDLAWMALQMADAFPSVQFYDYTKLPKAWQRTRSNYHLTFSHSENNSDECRRALEHGLNVAVVFDVKRGQPLPDTFMGSPVIDGDKHDLRFLDGYQSSIIGLRAKGPAKHDCSGFVVKHAAHHSSAFTILQ